MGILAVTCWVVVSGIIALLGNVMRSEILVGLGAIMILFTTCFVV